MYATNKTPIRLAGTQYIIFPTLFATLDMEECQLRHSHSYGVTSGFLIEPILLAAIDHSIMEVLVGTYGKTMQDKDITVGIPGLVMRYTGR